MAGDLIHSIRFSRKIRSSEFNTKSFVEGSFAGKRFRFIVHDKTQSKDKRIPIFN